MRGAQAHMLPDGRRLHLNHGPIDLIVEADDPAAYEAACKRFAPLLDELVCELKLLRMEVPRQGLALAGAVARRMELAVQPYWRDRVTPMAAVAGAVAEEVLAAMLRASPLRRAYVNNGGDIALHLEAGETFMIASPAGPIAISGEDGVRGIATSGWQGRSFSLGIADSVTVLAEGAAMADAAATIIANAVDLPHSPKVKRQPAHEIAPDSDLGQRLVTTGVEPLNAGEIEQALSRGMETAKALHASSLIVSASLLLQGRSVSLDNDCNLPASRGGLVSRGMATSLVQGGCLA